MTVDVQNWVDATMSNNGWAFIPWEGGTNGWGFASSDAVQNERPELRVFFTPPGVTVSPTADLVTSEAGGTAEFSVVLDTPPSDDVTVTLSSDDSTEGMVAPETLTFTADNWNVPQAVTITGVDDADPDGPVTYNILSTTASVDPVYDGLSGDAVSVTNIDNDTAGVTVHVIGDLVTTEAGGTATFEIVLNMQPADDVTIGLSSSNTGEGAPSPASVTFTPSNWDTPQIVTVTGVDDHVIDGPTGYTIITGAPTSNDPDYAALASFRRRRRLGDQ